MDHVCSSDQSINQDSGELKMMIMAAHLSCSSLSYSFPSFRNSSRSSFSRPRLSCSSTHAAGHRAGFTDFPYVLTSQKELMVDLVSTIETRLGPFLNPCSLPADVQSYQNETETAHGALYLRSGSPSSQVTNLLFSREIICMYYKFFLFVFL